MSADALKLVSVHGGHSGQFCCHASDSLEAIVDEYAAQGFQWVGITEHMPPVSDEFLYPDEIEAGLTSESLFARFAEYISVCRSLQRSCRDSLQILVGFETECYTGSDNFAKDLRSQFDPDYIVGSVHHVRDIPIDGTPEQYAKAAAEVGGLDELYCEYFDQQLRLLQTLKPEVVGHFDLIRIWDKDYSQRLSNQRVQDCIRRNLEKVGELGAILDFNVRAYEKGGQEPYVSAPILEMALELGIRCVPGDDSHGVAGVGLHLKKGIEILQQHGFSTDWPLPSDVSEGALP